MVLSPWWLAEKMDWCHWRKRGVSRLKISLRSPEVCVDWPLTPKLSPQWFMTSMEPAYSLVRDSRVKWSKWTALFNTPDQKGMAKRYVNLVRALCWCTCDRVRMCGELSSPLKATSGVRQARPISPSFNFIVNEVVDVLGLQGVEVELAYGRNCRLRRRPCMVVRLYTSDNLSRTVAQFSVQYSSTKF